MKLIIGLGNPGDEYINTRHNVGFRFLDFYLKYKGINEKWSFKNEGEYISTLLFGEKVIFLKPQTFMNLSGNCVRKYMDYFQIDVDDILVVSDDLDLIFGNFKLKSSGSSGGHNGLKDIESKIGSSNYKRLKVGISNDKMIDTKDYVLGKFSKEELKTIEKIIDDSNNIIQKFIDGTLKNTEDFQYGDKS